MADQPVVGDRNFRNQVVELRTLTVNTGLIDGYEFSNCRIIGPAVLAILDHVTIAHCTWDAPGLDAVFWEVPPERGPVVGALGVQNCTFSSCTFENVGVAGLRELRDAMEEGFRD